VGPLNLNVMRGESERQNHHVINYELADILGGE